MDPLTQGLLGAATAQLGFRQKIGRDATWMAFLSAMAPDLDIFARRGQHFANLPTNGFDRALAHRGISHSLIAVPVIALVIAAGWWAVRTWLHNRFGPPDEDKRPVGFWWLFACLTVAVLTHGPLDWCTSYGTQILAPFSTQRYAANLIGIVDIIYTPILLLTVVGCYLLRKLRPGRSARPTLWIGIVGFGLSLAYLGAGRWLHDRAIDHALAAAGRTKEEVDQGRLRADAYPSIGLITAWRVVLEDDQAWYVTRVHHLAATPASRVTVCPKERSNRWVRLALDRPGAEAWNWFAMGRMRAEYEPRGRFHVVRLYDMRYGWPLGSAQSLWYREMIWNDQADFVGVRHGSNRSGRMIADIWKSLWNP